MASLSTAPALTGAILLSVFFIGCTAVAVAYVKGYWQHQTTRLLAGKQTRADVRVSLSNESAVISPHTSAPVCWGTAGRCAPLQARAWPTARDNEGDSRQAYQEGGLTAPGADTARTHRRSVGP